MEHKQPAGRIVSRRVAPSKIAAFVSSPGMLLEEQKAHFRRALQKRKQLFGVLQGRQQEFAAAFVKAEGRLVLLDGYLRANAIAAGEVIPDNDFPYYLRTHFVDTREEANLLFEQYNNLSADKRFQAGLREGKTLHKLKSPLMKSRGRASAALQASGLREAKDAASALLPTILQIDALGLGRAEYEFSGTLGAYMAVLHKAPQGAKEAAKRFIQGVNSTTRPKNFSSAAAKAYRAWLRSTTVRTGAAANKEAFQRGLYHGAKHIFREAKVSLPQSLKPQEGQLDLQEFSLLMQSLK